MKADSFHESASFSKTQKISMLNLVNQRRSKEVLKKALKPPDHSFDFLLRPEADFPESSLQLAAELETLKKKVHALKREVKVLNFENGQLSYSLRKSREINKRLFLVLNDHGMLAECLGSSAVFKEVRSCL